MTASNDPLRIAAQTAWGEARGEGRAGMQAVLNVIGNRASYPGWWGTDVVSVCLARDQFSCWLPDGPGSDYAAMLAVTVDDAQFDMALALAAELIAGTLPDITGGADSYYADTIPPPSWVAPPGRAPATFTRKIGRQLFYITRPANAQAQPVPPAGTPGQITADLTAAIEGESA